MFKKQISTVVGILIIVLSAGVVSAGVLFFSQEDEEIVLLEEYIEHGKEKNTDFDENSEMEKDYIIIEKVLRGAGEKTIKIKEREGDWDTVIVEEVGFELDYPKEWELWADTGSPIGFEKYFDEDLEKHCSISILCGGQIMDYDDENYGNNQRYFYGDYKEELLCRAILSVNLQNENILECQNVLERIVSSVKFIE